jgi:hypothetical protein
VSCFKAGGEPLTGKLDSERRVGHVMIEIVTKTRATYSGRIARPNTTRFWFQIPTQMLPFNIQPMLPNIRLVDIPRQSRTNASIRPASFSS